MSEKVIKRLRKFNRLMNASYRTKKDFEAYKKMSWKGKTKFNQDVKNLL